MNTTSIAISLIVFVLGLVPGLAHSAGLSEVEIEKRIETALSDRHAQHTGEFWTALGETTPRVILRLYGATTSTVRRIKLLDGLAWFDNAEATALMKKEAAGGSGKIARTTAIHSLGRSQGERETEFLSGFLNDQDPDVRLAAALALKRLDSTPGVSAALEAFQKKEKQSWVLNRFQENPPSVISSTASMKPVSDSTQRLSPDWTGEWKGVWLAPDLREESTLWENLPVVVRLNVRDASRLEGEWSLRFPGKSEQKLRIDQARGADRKVAGTIPGVGRFEGELSEIGTKKKIFLIRLGIPDRGATLVLRR